MAMPAARQAAAIALAVAVLAGSRGTAQTGLSRDEILQRPLSPGVVALMIEHAAQADVRRRLAEALIHPHAETRAAAARVVFTANVRELETELAAALATELRPDPVVEQSRALAVLGGTAHDEAIITAWARVGRAGAWKAAEAYAAIRGGDALAAMPQLRAVDPTEAALRRYLRAARPDASALARLVDDALAAQDATLLGAALAAGRELDIEPAESRRIAALGPLATPGVRRAAVMDVLRAWDGAGPLSAPLRAALAAVGPLATDAGDLAARLALELAHRAGGAPPSTTPDWNAVLDNPGDRLAFMFRLASAQRLLARPERRRARQDLPPPPDRIERAARAPGAAAAATLQSIDRYPPGFLSGILAATGCDVAKARTEAIGAGAGAATLRRDGRVARVTLIDTGLRQERCAQALRLLLMTHVADAHPPGDGEERVLVVPFDPEYVACREAQTPVAPLTPVDGATSFAPPARTRHVNPVYPQAALSARVQGIVGLEAVIGTSGCVQDVRVTRSVDPRLDLAALRNVIDWRFSPTEIDGTPVPVTMMVTVQFSAR